MKRFVSIFIFLILTDFVAGQIPWLATSFEINDHAVRMFYLDSLEGHFYIGGNMYWVDSIKTNNIFRIDSNEAVNRLDTVNWAAEPPLAMIRYKDTLYLGGIMDYSPILIQFSQMFSQHVRFLECVFTKENCL